MVEGEKRKERIDREGIVAVLFDPDGRVLVFRDQLKEDSKKWENAGDGYFGKVRGWYFIGGVIEKEEDVLKAIQREIREETSKDGKGTDGFGLVVGRERVFKLGEGFEVQEREKGVIKCPFLVLGVRLGEKEFGELMKLIEKNGKRIVFLHPWDRKEMRQYQNRFRPRDAKVMEILMRNAVNDF